MHEGRTRGAGRDAEEREPASPPGYEPPAIVWEEAFEAVSATSCALTPLGPDQCSAKQTT